MRQSLQVHGVLAQFGLSWRLERANCLPIPYSYVHRQLVPALGTRHSECAGAKVRDRGTDYKVATSGGSESLSAADGCDWSTEVGDVRRCQSMQRLVHQQTHLELDALRDGKPVKAVSQHLLDVVVLLGAAVFITDCSRSS